MRAQLRPSPLLEKHVAPQFWTKFNVSSLVVMVDPVEASFAVTLPVQIGNVKTWIEAFVVPGSTPHLIFSTVALSASMYGEF